MRKVKVGDYTIELDEKFVEKYEEVTCGTIDVFAKHYLCLHFNARTLNEALRKCSKKEAAEIIINYMKADIEINE